VRSQHTWFNFETGLLLVTFTHEVPLWH